MSTRRSAQNKRCPVCQIRPIWCFCSSIPKLDFINTKIDIIRHKSEDKLPSNTSRFIKLINATSSIHTHGKEGENIEDSFKLAPECTPVYLFPDDDAIELSEFRQKHPHQKIQLIVPDGTWRQTKKFKRRIEVLKDIPSVKINRTNDIIYRLRKQNSMEGMCTLEAMAYALNELEGKSFADPIFKLLDHMNQSFSFSRDMALWHRHLTKA
jgi:DTW domain-containing protein YfiP